VSGNDDVHRTGLRTSDPLAPFTDRLRLAVAAYLARFEGSSRRCTESDLRCYLAWCAVQGLDPLAAQRPHVELYIRWMQEIRRFKPSTVSRRFSVTAGFYRTCAIDGILEHSPAEHVRRPAVPTESPTLGFTHLQFEALLTAARESPNPYDFALVAMLGLLGLRIFEATGADIADLGEEHGHWVLRVCGKGTKVVLVPLPPAVGRALDRAAGDRSRGPILLNSRGARMAGRRPPAACAASPGPSASRPPGRTRTCFAIRSSRRCSMLAWTSGTCRSPPATPTRGPRCGMTGPGRTWTATRTTSWPPTWPPVPYRTRVSRELPWPRRRPELPR
jgi:integrase/recombinase XerD